MPLSVVVAVSVRGSFGFSDLGEGVSSNVAILKIAIKNAPVVFADDLHRLRQQLRIGRAGKGDDGLRNHIAIVA